MCSQTVGAGRGRVVANRGSRENRADAKAVSQVTGDGELNLGGSDGAGSGYIR